MSIPTEPIGSIPRPRQLLDAIARAGGNHDDAILEGLSRDTIRDTVFQFEAQSLGAS